MQRGYFHPPRLKISTTYPTGLVVAWSYFTPDLQGLVYPSPIRFESLQYGVTDSPELGTVSADGGSDFGEIRA